MTGLPLQLGVRCRRTPRSSRRARGPSPTCLAHILRKVACHQLRPARKTVGPDPVFRLPETFLTSYRETMTVRDEVLIAGVPWPVYKLAALARRRRCADRGRRRHRECRRLPFSPQPPQAPPCGSACASLPRAASPPPAVAAGPDRRPPSPRRSRTPHRSCPACRRTVNTTSQPRLTLPGRDHPQGVVHRLARGQPHHVVEHPVLVGRRELDDHLAHRRIGDPAVRGLPQPRPPRARTPTAAAAQDPRRWRTRPPERRRSTH